ncbi:hypothetical protein VTN00DRAFT_9418 [Thermoascus crustaceus]|uniref:uncharacterized protein n=1 Tax=Thermoascus crustaceus TaxID=5088 RepID=UPI003743431C
MIRSTTTLERHSTSTVHHHSTEIIPILFTVLPASLRRRIAPGVDSLHRSIRLNWLSRNSDNSSGGKNSELELHGGIPACAPEPRLRCYDTNLEESTQTGRPATVAGGNSGQELLSSSFLSGSLLESQGSSSTSTPPEGNRDSGPLPKYEVESGLKWNRVTPALNLLRNAGYEAQQPRSDSHLVRSLYINAILYLLEALPEDLTCEEYTSIQNRLPEKARQATLSSLPEASAAHNLNSIPRDRSNPQPTTGPTPTEPSYLHRLLATLTIQCFLLIQFLLPYARLLLHHIYEYERTHRITEHIATITLNTANSLGKGGINIVSAMLSLSEGRVGAAVSAVAAWWIEGLAGGICEGIGEGMVILGVGRDGGGGATATAVDMTGLGRGRGAV